MDGRQLHHYEYTGIGAGETAKNRSDLLLLHCVALCCFCVAVAGVCVRVRVRVCVCVFCGEKPKAIMNRIRYVPIKWIPCQKRFLNSNCFRNPLFPSTLYSTVLSRSLRVIGGFGHFRHEKEIQLWCGKKNECC